MAFRVQPATACSMAIACSAMVLNRPRRHRERMPTRCRAKRCQASGTLFRWIDAEGNSTSRGCQARTKVSARSLAPWRPRSRVRIKALSAVSGSVQRLRAGTETTTAGRFSSSADDGDQKYRRLGRIESCDDAGQKPPLSLLIEAPQEMRQVNILFFTGRMDAIKMQTFYLSNRKKPN